MQQHRDSGRFHQHSTELSCRLAHLPACPPQARLSRLREPPEGHTAPTDPPLPSARPRPGTRLPEALMAPKPGPLGNRDTRQRETDQLLSPGGKVTAQRPRPACDRATCRAWQAPSFSSFPWPAPGHNQPGRPPGSWGSRRPLAIQSDPHTPRRPRRRTPTPVPQQRTPTAVPGVLRRQRRPHSRSPGPGQSCVGETSQREGAGGGVRRQRKGERAQYRFGLLHPPRTGKRKDRSTTARASRRRRARPPPPQPREGH